MKFNKRSVEVKKKRIFIYRVRYTIVSILVMNLF